MSKRIINWFIGFVMLLMIFPMTVSADSWEYSERMYGTLTNTTKSYDFTVATKTKVNISYANTSPRYTNFRVVKKGDSWFSDYILPKSRLDTYYDGDYQYGIDATYELEPGTYRVVIYMEDYLHSFSKYWIRIGVYNHTHNYQYDRTVSATCTREGYSVYECTGCGAEQRRNYTDKLAHTPVTNTRVEPTCVTPGKAADGKVCSKCGTVIKTPSTIPATGRHTEVIVPGYAPTCVKTGLTDGKKCSVCGVTTLERKEIPATGIHKEITVKGVAPTCVEEGLSDGKKCSVCGKITVKQTTVSPTGKHIEKIIQGYEPDCTSEGASEGKECVVCENTTVEAEVIPSLGHDFSDGICQRCGNPSEYIASGKCGKDGDPVYWRVDMDGTLVLYGNGVPYFHDWDLYDYSVRDLIEAVRIEDGVEILINEGFVVFDYLENIKKIELADSLEYLPYETIPLFSEVSSIRLPESLKRIDQSAFYLINQLQEMCIPAKQLRSIEAGAFRDTAIKDIFYGGTEEDWRKIIIEERNEELLNATMHYYQEGTCGDGVFWELDRKCLTISGNGTMSAYADPQNVPWADELEHIDYIIIEDDVITVDANVLNGCPNLINIQFKGNPPVINGELTGVKTIRYPSNNPAWDQAVRDSFGDEIIWEGYVQCEHEFDKWSTLHTPTCEQHGSKRRDCKHCEYYELEYLKYIGHNWSEGVVSVEPTIHTPGIKESNCLNCGASQTEVLDELKKSNTFIDVKEEDYFFEPVIWALGKNITSGTTKTTFSPNNGCTRAEAITLLWRAAGCPNPEKNAIYFMDVQYNTWYTKAVLWGVENGIVYGINADHFAPNAVCTRAEIMTFLYRYANEPKVNQTNNPFTDVANGTWYKQPVLWAVENMITSGYTSISFAPEAACTRAQIVSFLYRYHVK